MNHDHNLIQIATIRTGFPEKFGIPRQSGLTSAVGMIVFEPEYQNPDALRGIESYSHLWLVWGFSEVNNEKWRPTVRPPRLGGNTRVGVFATRSPFRPNPIGLSCVELLEIKKTLHDGYALIVKGVDMMDGSPIYDIKPYLPYVDVKMDAKGGFAEERKVYALNVHISREHMNLIPEEHVHVLIQVLSQDPRPSYQNDPERIYGMTYAGLDVKFRVDGEDLEVLHVEKHVK